MNPDFKEKAAHVTDRFKFVDMWLRQAGDREKAAIVYWRQAGNFYRANAAVDELAKPLTSYYCILNMSKALLVSKGTGMARIPHGVSGYGVGAKTALSNEIVKFKGSGVLAELCQYFEETVSEADQYNLTDLLYNLPHIHRAYCMTIPSRKKRELFIPLQDCSFFKVDDTNECFFRGTLTNSWSTGRTRTKLPAGFEIDPTAALGSIAVRKKKRFRWEGRKENLKIGHLQNYHKKLRRQIFQIFDAPGYWYLKRDIRGGISDGLVDKNPTVIAFAAMHRLSELSRYDPDKLARHFNNRYGWLLNEFLARTLDQVLDDLASEITGCEVE
jgi:hypothetical protein